MGIFVNKLKIRAAVGSMHQFCAPVRMIYPEPPSDDVVEATTVFLYERLARATFGNRFADRWLESVSTSLKYVTPADLKQRLLRIGRNVEEFDRQEMNPGAAVSDHEQFTRNVRSVIRALLVEAGAPHDDPVLVKLIFPRFQSTAQRLRDHLQGINEQARFVMR